MVLKRKRSVTELCSSPSSDSSFNSPPHNVAGVINPFAHYDVTPIHLHSRTMKRFRNSRPSEEEVHRRTLNMLFSAQQHQPQVDAMDAMTSEQMMRQQNSRPKASQQSLHRFWNISSAPSATLESHAVQQPAVGLSSCDDCGTSLTDGMMDVDGFDVEAHACGACGKHVCFSCSVSNLGEQRRCLQCANSKPSAVSMNWTGPGLQFC